MDLKELEVMYCLFLVIMVWFLFFIRIFLWGNWLDDSGELFMLVMLEVFLFMLFEGDWVSCFDLVNWMVDKDNFLVVCVMVNWFWKICFGEGFVWFFDDVGL